MSEQTEGADADKASRQYMQQEAPQKLDPVQRDRLGAGAATRTAAHLNDHPPAVDVFARQCQDFGQTQARAVERRQQGVVLEVHGGIEQSGDFFATQHRRWLAPHLRSSDLFDHPGLAERLGVEELQSHTANPKCGPSDLVVFDEVELILADVLGTELVRRLLAVPREIGHGAGVRADRLRRVVSQPQIVDHSLA